ncbi:MAG: glycosyltransferase family 4 protein, partial [Bdellovibrionales bacterium]|nr:glycosyltransferase family 4 protein [Bdellovibrionales bacterium]
TLKQQLVYPLQMRTKSVRDVQLFHFPAHMDGPSWSPARYMLTVLDLIPLVHAELYKADRPGWRFKLARWLEIQSIKNASHLLAISECTAQDLERVLGIPRERVTVTPLGVDQKFFSHPRVEDEASLRSRLGIPQNRPILLYVGGIDQRKNWGTLLSTLSHVRDYYREKAAPLPVLVMAGGNENDRQYPKLLSMITEKKLSDDVVLPGFVSDQDILLLYAITDVVCFLSLYEGFGLPVLEAMAAGVPVVCSNTSSIPEVAGDACELVDPTDAKQAADRVIGFLDNSEKALSFAARGICQAEKFSWSRTGEQTLLAYEACMRG